MMVKRLLMSVGLVVGLGFCGVLADDGGMKFEFGEGKGEPRWVSVNDGVMGGLSKGGAEMKDGVMVFSGVLSLENNGGFSSVRTRGYEADLSGAKGIVLRVKGDGRTYTNSENYLVEWKLFEAKDLCFAIV